MATTLVPSGACEKFEFDGDKPERVEIHQGGGALIGPVTYDGRAGLNIATVEGPSFHPF
ncbi:hypothetical protein ABZ805_03760 [Saccharopolyspora sp. NPDC047091]|uniref:hypothetical protein n=1 Tax=Saccharopolyspora sp. NPDC047091 TaxID=3155924 RepID=UPI0033F17FE6